MNRTGPFRTIGKGGGEGTGEKILFYYFAFPVYRLQILRALAAAAEAEDDLHIDFAAGLEAKGEIKILSRDDFPPLRELDTLSRGPAQWQRGIVGTAVKGSYGAVVLGPSIGSASTFAILLARRVLGRRTYLWGQCGKLGDRSPRRRAQEVLNRLATGLLVYGEIEKASAAELGTPMSRIHVVNNATERNDEDLASDVDVYGRTMEKIRAARDDGKLRLLYLGRIIKEKRVETLLAASRLLRADFPDLEMHVVGGGEALDELRRTYADPHIVYHGAVYGKQNLAPYLEAATLVCAPNTMGLLAVDALRAGVPVLIPDSPRNASEIESLTPGVNSRFFTPADPASMAEEAKVLVAEMAEVPREKFESARDEQLRCWSPDNVAGSILRAVRSGRV